MKSMAAPALISPPGCLSLHTYRNPEAAQRSKADTRLAWSFKAEAWSLELWGRSRNPPRLSPPNIIRIREHQIVCRVAYLRLYSWLLIQQKGNARKLYIQ